MGECPFCHRMKTRILNRPELQGHFREHFPIFPVDSEGDVELVAEIRLEDGRPLRVGETVVLHLE